MLQLSQIQEAHARVKSGADFPAYVQEMKVLGVARYEHFVADGRITYSGRDGSDVSAAPKWPPLDISPQGDARQLRRALTIHQAGGTDYPTFCAEAAAAGVEKWVVDIRQMACTYYDDQERALLVEAIPES